MSKHEQTSGSCGHRRSPWDTHASCLSCCKCTRSNPCAVCQDWTSGTWDLADKRRVYAKRKPRASSQVKSMFLSDSASGSEGLYGSEDGEISAESVHTDSQREQSLSPSRVGRRSASNRGRSKKRSASGSSPGGSSNHPRDELLDYDDSGLSPQSALASGTQGTEVALATDHVGSKPRSTGPTRTRDSKSNSGRIVIRVPGTGHRESPSRHRVPGTGSPGSFSSPGTGSHRAPGTGYHRVPGHTGYRTPG